MSRIWAILAAFASSFCRDELQAAIPHVEAALRQVPDDIKASKPLVAFTGTVHAAMQSMASDPKASLTGVLGAAATAALNGALAPSSEQRPQTHE